MKKEIQNKPVMETSREVFATGLFLWNEFDWNIVCLKGIK